MSSNDEQHTAQRDGEQEKTQAQVKSLEIRVLRQDSLEHPRTRRWETYAVSLPPTSTLAEALRAAQCAPLTTDGSTVAPLAFDHDCQQGLCGACSVLVDGRVTLACTAKLGDLSPRGRRIEVAPLSKFPLIRDLVVDRGAMEAGLQAMATPLDADVREAPHPHPTQEQQQVLAALSRCIGCAACLEACPEYGPHSEFLGPVVLAEAERGEHVPHAALGREVRLAVATGPGGIDDCGNAHNCAEVCPVGVPLTEALGRLSRLATRRWFAHLLGG